MLQDVCISMDRNQFYFHFMFMKGRILKKKNHFLGKESI